MPKVQETSKGLAIFDLDYTITRQGTWGRFVWSWVKFRPYIWLPLLLAAGVTQWEYKKGKRPRQDVKLAMMRWAMKGASRSELLRRGQEFARRDVEAGLRPKAKEVIAAHRANGDKLIMISAAVDVLAEPIGQLLGFDDVLSTEMAFDEEGRLKLSFNTPNCYGEEKVKRLEALLDSRPELAKYAQNITFYSDSHSDLPAFMMAHKCVAVHPNTKLRAYADENNWDVADWS